MSFNLRPFWPILLLGTAITPHLYAADTTLTLPADASIGVEVIEPIRLDTSTSEAHDVLLHPAQVQGASHALPDYCLLTASLQRNNDRLRITTEDATCIETNEAESAIFSGEFEASAYADSGEYGLPCEPGKPCGLAPGEAFTLTVGHDVSIEAQDNPSAKINEARRNANQDGAQDGNTSE